MNNASTSPFVSFKRALILATTIWYSQGMATKHSLVFVKKRVNSTRLRFKSVGFYDDVADFYDDVA